MRVCSSNLLFTVDKKRTGRIRKSCLLSSFILLLHAKNVKHKEIHIPSFPFYSFLYSVITSKCRRQWRRDIKRKKKENKEYSHKKIGEEKKKAYERKKLYSERSMSDPLYSRYIYFFFRNLMKNFYYLEIHK